MSLVDTLVTRLGRPAGRALDPTIRDLVQAVLKEQGYASPAEVQALRDEVHDLRARVDTMTARLGAVVQAAELARSEAAARPVVDVAPLQARIAELEARLAAPPPAVAAAPAAPAPLAAELPATCKVPGCEAAFRSKGFCSAHYQQWRRGTLKGFVGLDGHLVLDEQTFTVDAALAGAAGELRGGRVFVDGKAV